MLASLFTVTSQVTIDSSNDHFIRLHLIAEYLNWFVAFGLKSFNLDEQTEPLMAHGDTKPKKRILISHAYMCPAVELAIKILSLIKRIKGDYSNIKVFEHTIKPILEPKTGDRQVAALQLITRIAEDSKMMEKHELSLKSTLEEPLIPVKPQDVFVNHAYRPQEKPGSSTQIEQDPTSYAQEYY